MGRYLIYVRQSYRRDSDADVSEDAQEAAARRLLPSGSTATVIRDTEGHNSGSTDRRDGYQRLIAEMREPDVLGIAVYDISRLARNARLMLNLKHELDGRNLHLIVSNLPDSRFDTAIGRFLFGQLALAAQLQRDLDSERQVGLTRTKFDQGGHNGLDPFGYRSARNVDGSIARPHRLEIVEDEADLVRLIFDRYAMPSAGSTGALAAALNAEGHRRIVRGRDANGTIADVARPWTDKGVADVLRRVDFYLGFVTYRRGAERRPGTHPPIIAPEQASAVARVKLRRHRPGRPDVQHRTYVLQGIAYCPCGLRMRGEAVARPGRPEYRYYRCPGRRDGRCASVNVPAAVVEARIVEHLASHATPAELVAAMRDALTLLRHIPDEGLRAQRAIREQALARIGERFVWGHITEAEYHAQRRPIEVQLANLPRPEDANVLHFDRTAGRLLPLAAVLRGTTPEHHARIIPHVVERVVIEGRDVVEMRVRLEARPFFAEIQDGMAVAPPDGARALAAYA